MVDEHSPSEALSAGRRIKIAFTLHELGQGGTDRVCAHLARGFAEAGFAVELVVLFGCGPSTDAMLALVGPGVCVRVLNPRRGSRNLDRLVALPSLVAGLRASAPDVLVSTGNNMNWTTALAFQLARLGGVPLVLKITNPVIRAKDGAVRRVYRRLRYRHAFARASAVLTLCDSEAEALATAFPAAAGRIHAVVNPYVTPEMLRTGEAPDERERDIVLAIGRLAPQKRFDLLIRAFAKVRSPARQLIILGDGPERGALEALVRELGLGDRIALPGYVPDVAAWFGRAALFVLSSRYEGLPAVVLEAMAARCPVVTTACFLSAGTLVGTAEGCAVVVDPTPESLARAIDACWRSERPSVLSEVAGRFSIANGVRSHVNVIEGLVARRRAIHPGRHAPPDEDARSSRT